MKRRHVYYALFWAYCAVMFCLLFGRPRLTIVGDYWSTLPRHVNLIPLHTARLFANVLAGDYSDQMRREAVVNLVGNVIMFLPLGYLMPMLWARFRKFWKSLLWGAAIIVCVELIQLFCLVGKCDVDDLLLNMVGIAMGYGLFWLFCRYGTEKTS